MVIELTDVVFYKKGAGGVSRVVGTDWDNGAPANRVARYTFTAPDTGANHISLSFPYGELGNGSHIPIRYYIGQDPESHKNADERSAFTGELTLGQNDQYMFSASADIVLLPSTTYYMWLFPGSSTFGWYYWERQQQVATITINGSAYLVPVINNGTWWHAFIHCVWKRKYWLCALCVVKNGKWYLAGSQKNK